MDGGVTPDGKGWQLTLWENILHLPTPIRVQDRCWANACAKERMTALNHQAKIVADEDDFSDVDVKAGMKNHFEYSPDHRPSTVGTLNAIRHLQMTLSEESNFLNLKDGSEISSTTNSSKLERLVGRAKKQCVWSAVNAKKLDNILDRTNRRRLQGQQKIYNLGKRIHALQGAVQTASNVKGTMQNGHAMGRAAHVLRESLINTKNSGVQWDARSTKSGTEVLSGSVCDDRASIKSQCLEFNSSGINIRWN